MNKQKPLRVITYHERLYESVDFQQTPRGLSNGNS